MKKKSNKKPFFRFVKCIVRLFKKKPIIINQQNILEEPCLYISNHAASYGPTNYELYFPTNFRMMGAYQMCGTLKERWAYLYKVYFYQKRKVPKWLAIIIATIITPFMIMFYKGMQIIPIFPDTRFRKTIDEAISSLEKGISALIFPEDSSDGYHDELKGLFGGFWIIAKEYKKRCGKDLKIVPMYLHRKSNQIVVDKNESYSELSKSLNSHKDAAIFFMDKVNNLYKKIINKNL